MCGLGGDLWALIRDGEVTCLNRRGRAGSGANPDRLRAAGRTYAASRRGRFRAVPGVVDGWLALRAPRPIGFASLLDAAIDLAERFRRVVTCGFVGQCR